MGMQHLAHQSQHDRRPTIFTDSAAAIRRIMIYMPGPEQDRPSRLSTSVVARWLPGHEGIIANETTDLYARQVAEAGGVGGKSTAGDSRVGLSFLGRGAAEKAARKWGEDIAQRSRGGHSKGLHHASTSS